MAHTERRCRTAARNRIAAVQRRLAVHGEVPQQHRLLRRQHARLVQLQQHALDPVGLLVDVFQEQHAALDARPVRRAQQRHQHAQVAAPQRPFQLQPVEAGLGAEAHGLQLAVHGFAEAGCGDVVHAAGLVAAAEVLGRGGPGPADAAAMGQQAQVQRGDVAQSDPARAGLDAARQQRPVDAVEQPRQAVAAAQRHGDRRRLRGDAVQCAEPHLVAAAEALVALQRVGVEHAVEAQRGQAALRQAHRRGLDRHARRTEKHQAGHRGSGSGSGGRPSSTTSPVGMRCSAGGSASSPGRSLRCCARRSAKNSRNSCPQAAASTPPTNSV